MGVNWTTAAQVFNQTTSNISDMQNRKRMLDMEAQLQPLRMQGIQQGLDLGAAQLAGIKHEQALWPEQDALRKAMDQINMGINKINLKGARFDAEAKAQESANARILNPLQQMAAATTLGSQIANSKLDMTFNKKLLDGLNTAKAHLQSEQDKLGALESAARGNIDQLMAQLEEERPGFSANTATRNAALRMYLDKTRKGFAPNDVMNEMLQLMAGRVDQREGVLAGQMSAMTDISGPPLPEGYAPPSSPFFPQHSFEEVSRQLGRYGEVRYGPSGMVLEK